jgi:uncharacterized membrane protein
LPRVRLKAQLTRIGVIMTFLIFLILVVGAVLAYRYRVPLIAKITGQQESRIRRALEQRKRN